MIIIVVIHVTAFLRRVSLPPDGREQASPANVGEALLSAPFIAHMMRHYGVVDNLGIRHHHSSRNDHERSLFKTNNMQILHVAVLIYMCRDV